MLSPESPRWTPGSARQALHLLGWATVTYLALVMAYGSIQYVFGDMRDFSPWFRQKFVANLIWLRIHAIGGSVALVTGPMQFSLWIRCRWRLVHRLTGCLYLGAVAITAMSSFLLGPNSFGGTMTKMSGPLLVAMWLVTAWKAMQSLYAGRVDQHRAWMLRNYAITFVTVTCRLYHYVFESLEFDFTTIYAWVNCVGWIPNLVAVEIYLWLERRQAVRQV